MSLTRRLVIVVVAVLVPAMLAAAWGVTQVYRSQNAAAEDTLRQLARALAAVVEQELAHRLGVLQTLAQSPRLQQGDLATFYEYAKRLAPSVERTIVLAELDGQQVVNTRLPFRSAQLPAVRTLPAQRERLGLAPEASLVSDLYFAPVGKRHSFAVQVPVVRDGAVAYYLSMGTFADTLQKLLDDQRLHAGWNAAILDRRGMVVARRLEPERYVGKPATADLLASLQRTREGLMDTVRLDGVGTLTAYTPIGESGWSFVVSMPRADLQAGLARAVGATVAVMLLLFAIAIGAAVFAGRAITRPLRALVDSAEAVGRGEPPAPPGRHALAESRLIAAGLARAADEVRQARGDLERRVAAAVAESQRAQEALLRHQKLEALGRLTGGIAHDFNNLLQTMSVSVELILKRSRDPHITASAEAGKRSVQSAVKLTRQLMSFGRSQSAARDTVDLRDQMLKLQDLMVRALRSDIALELDLAGDLWPVTLDTVQLELALLNAALNARDAMGKGGRFVISAFNARLANGEEPGVAAGEYVRLTLADNGAGITPDNLPRVFEPFFTTKDVGKGSGLGLAQVYAFAVGAGGAAKIQSAPGQGTKLVLYLPRAEEPASTPAREHTPAVREPSATRTVLFVEDDALVRSVVAPALHDAGFKVLLANDVAQALALVRAERIDVVFSDIVMPGGRNGIDLASELRRTNPELPIVLATGYADTPALPAGVRVLNKPYRIDEVCSALDAARR